ncbi:MAG: DUF3014 domain-containing protein [Nevskia sp.]|nr:DUF3014 domain-containing protein [Nevskia sp.]
MSANRWGLILVVALLAAAGTWFKWFKPVPPAPPTPIEAIADPAPPPPPPDYPVPGAAPEAPALPTIADSDSSFGKALIGLPGAAPIEAWLIPDMLIRRIVVTIDNLPRDRVAVKLRPLKPVAGEFLVDASKLGYTIGVANASRYNSVVSLLAAISDDALVALYFRWYPLFQQAYRELGYPQGKFNNRVVEVLDHLIATPEISEPVPLLRPKVHYEYAEPAQETASAGRKLLWRIGREHRLAVIAKLKSLRARIVVGAAPAAAP